MNTAATPAAASRPLLVAHRGFHRFHPENTLPALEAAFTAGMDMVEFDVQLSADGLPFLFHDDDGRRLCGDGRELFRLPFSEIEKLTVKPASSGPGPSGSAEGARGRRGETAAVPYRIPSLADYLASRGEESFYLELKVPQACWGDSGYVRALCRAVLEALRGQRLSASSFCASFHPEAVLLLARERPEMPRALILEGKGDLARKGLGEVLEAASSVSVPWPWFDRERRKAGRAAASENPVLARFASAETWVWNIDAPADLQAALGIGLRGLVTDAVEALLEKAKAIGEGKA